MTGRKSRDERRYHSRRHRHDRSNSRSRSRLDASSSLARRRDRPVARSCATPPRRDPFRHDSRDRTLDLILARLTTIEATLPGCTSSVIQSHSDNERHVQLPLLPVTPVTVETGNKTAPETAETAPCHSAGEGSSTDRQKDATDRVVGALLALSKVRSQNYYISPFDPNVHDFDVWSAEVESAKQVNNWDDRECLGRISGSLRGDAKSWINEWVTTDRTWSNFKIEFRSLCPRNIDVATILYDVMCTNSDKFTTYAEYARKSLFRLNIVTGLSEELKVAIIARGISDPHVKAATVNAKPSSKQLVEFLSAFVKPKANANSNKTVRASPVRNVGTYAVQKREFNKNSHIKCRLCGNNGHHRNQCTRAKLNKSAHQSGIQSSSTTPKPMSSDAIDNRLVKHCSFCKRGGHIVENCFQKQRSDAARKSNITEVNFCLESSPDGQT